MLGFGVEENRFTQDPFLPSTGSMSPFSSCPTIIGRERERWTDWGVFLAGRSRVGVELPVSGSTAHHPDSGVALPQTSGGFGADVA